MPAALANVGYTPAPIPLALHREGWRLETPPPPQLEKTAKCSKDTEQGCRPDCLRKPRRHANRGVRQPGRLPNASAAGAIDVCERCECALCAICSKPSNRWTSPSGQVIETVTTRTEPRFTFAYNPYDDDMRRMRKTMILEPTLTHAWYEATAACCNRTGGLVIDVGGNFGWYTLYSLALGCEVAVFEPVPAYQEVLRLGVSLNPGFAERTTLYGNVVYDTPGNYTLRVPYARASGRMKKLGMTGMKGSAGILKSDWRAASYEHHATSVRLDDVIGKRRNVCMLKADVEGYEPQVLQTASALLRETHVPNLQLELTKTPTARNQTCAAVKMLGQLSALGYEFRQVPNRLIDVAAPPIGTWGTEPGPWVALPPIPSARTSASAARVNRLGLFGKRGGDMRKTAEMWGVAYRADFTTFSTNLIARRRPAAPCASLTGRLKGGPCPQWPSLTC